MWMWHSRIDEFLWCSMKMESRLATFLLKFFMWNTRCNTFAIIIPGFSDSESDIGNDIPSISSDIIGMLNQKNRYTRFIKNMWQSASIYVRLGVDSMRLKYLRKISYSMFYWAKQNIMVYILNFNEGVSHISTHTYGFLMYQILKTSLGSLLWGSIEFTEEIFSAQLTIGAIQSLLSVS